MISYLKRIVFNTNLALGWFLLRKRILKRKRQCKQPFGSIFPCLYPVTTSACATIIFQALRATAARHILPPVIRCLGARKKQWEWKASLVTKHDLTPGEIFTMMEERITTERNFKARFFEASATPRLHQHFQLIPKNVLFQHFKIVIPTCSTRPSYLVYVPHRFGVCGLLSLCWKSECSGHTRWTQANRLLFAVCAPNTLGANIASALFALDSLIVRCNLFDKNSYMG